VVSPGHNVLRHPKQLDSHTIYTNHVTNKGYTTFHGTGGGDDVRVPGISRGVLIYAQAPRPAIRNYVASPMVANASDGMDDKICHMYAQTTGTSTKLCSDMFSVEVHCKARRAQEGQDLL
jgi:hypothetical protein